MRPALLTPTTGSGAIALLVLLTANALVYARPSSPEAQPFSEALCPTATPSDRFRVQTGYATANTQAAAIGAARDDAMQGMLDCDYGGVQDGRCQGNQQHIVDWKQSTYRARFGDACATVTNEVAALNRLVPTQQRLEADIDALAQQVAQSDLALVRHEDPIWANGCSAGQVRRYLVLMLDRKLGAHKVRFDGGQFPSAGAALLKLRLSPAEGVVRTSAALRVPASRTSAAVHSVGYHMAAAGERLCLRHGHTAAVDHAFAMTAIWQTTTCGGAC